MNNCLPRMLPCVLLPYVFYVKMLCLDVTQLIEHSSGLRAFPEAHGRDAFQSLERVVESAFIGKAAGLGYFSKGEIGSLQEKS